MGSLIFESLSPQVLVFTMNKLKIKAVQGWLNSNCFKMYPRFNNQKPQKNIGKDRSYCQCYLCLFL